MLFKLEAKEKFNVIIPEGPDLSASLTEAMEPEIVALLENEVKNVVLSLKNVATSEQVVADILARVQSAFYANESSFVVCEMADGVKKALEEAELYDGLNIVPTESEAWDMVQMEEIERELMREDPE